MFLCISQEYISELLDRVDEKVLIFAHHKFVMDDISAILTKHLKAEQETKGFEFEMVSSQYVDMNSTEKDGKTEACSEEFKMACMPLR